MLSLTTFPSNVASACPAWQGRALLSSLPANNSHHLISYLQPAHLHSSFDTTGWWLKSQILIQNHLYLRGNLGKLSLSLNLTLTPTCRSRRLVLRLLTHTAAVTIYILKETSLDPHNCVRSPCHYIQIRDSGQSKLFHWGRDKSQLREGEWGWLTGVLLQDSVKLPWRLSQSPTVPLTWREMSILALRLKGWRTTLFWDASQTGHHLL